MSALPSSTKEAKWPHLLCTVLRTFFALLLLASAAGKFLDMPGFYAIVDSYDVLADQLVPALAWTLALSELVLAVWLLLGIETRLAALGVVAIHIAYISWVGLALLRGLSLPNCGCFGVYLARPLTAFTLLEDVVLLMLAVALWRLAPVRK
jgi:Methylamine utilisation protein MauE